MKYVDLFKYSLFFAICDKYPSEEDIEKYKNTISYLITDYWHLKKELLQNVKTFDPLIKSLYENTIWKETGHSSPSNPDNIINWLFNTVVYKTNYIYLLAMYYENLSFIQDYEIFNYVGKILANHDIILTEGSTFLDFVYCLIKDFERPKEKQISTKSDLVLRELTSAFLEIQNVCRAVPKHSLQLFVTDDVNSFCDKHCLTLDTFLNLPFTEVTQSCIHMNCLTTIMSNFKLNPIKDELF